MLPITTRQDKVADIKDDQSIDVDAHQGTGEDVANSQGLTACDHYLKKQEKHIILSDINFPILTVVRSSLSGRENVPREKSRLGSPSIQAHLTIPTAYS